MSLVTSSPTNQGRTTKPRPARQSGSLSDRPQTARKRLAMTHRQGRNIYANPTRGFSRGWRMILPVRQRSWDCPFMQSDAGKTKRATGPTGGEMTGDLACYLRRKTQARFHQSAVYREVGLFQYYGLTPLRQPDGCRPLVRRLQAANHQPRYNYSLPLSFWFLSAGFAPLLSLAAGCSVAGCCTFLSSGWAAFCCFPDC